MVRPISVWFPAKIEQLRRLSEADVDPAVAAVQLGTTTKELHRISRREGLTWGWSGGHPKYRWYPSRVALLRELAGRGLMISETMAFFPGATFYAIASAAGREGIRFQNAGRGGGPSYVR